MMAWQYGDFIIVQTQHGRYTVRDVSGEVLRTNLQSLRHAQVYIDQLMRGYGGAEPMGMGGMAGGVGYGRAVRPDWGAGRSQQMSGLGGLRERIEEQPWEATERRLGWKVGYYPPEGALEGEWREIGQEPMVGESNSLMRRD